MKMCPSRHSHLATNATPLIRLVVIITLTTLFQPLSTLWAQVTNDRILAPEVSHFTGIKEPGVDVHGDLYLLFL